MKKVKEQKEEKEKYRMEIIEELRRMADGDSVNDLETIASTLSYLSGKATMVLKGYKPL